MIKQWWLEGLIHKGYYLPQIKCVLPGFHILVNVQIFYSFFQRHKLVILSLTSSIVVMQVYFAAINCWHWHGECHQHFPRIRTFPLLLAYIGSSKGIQYRGPLQGAYMSKFLEAILRPLERVNRADDLDRLLVKSNVSDHNIILYNRYKMQGKRNEANSTFSSRLYWQAISTFVFPNHWVSSRFIWPRPGTSNTMSIGQCHSLPSPTLRLPLLWESTWKRRKITTFACICGTKLWYLLFLVLTQNWF